MAKAIVALHSAGYQAKPTQTQPRPEHPDHVVIATERFFEDEVSLQFHPDQPTVDPRASNGALNRDIGDNALRTAGVEFVSYSYGGAAQGGSAAHRWLQVVRVDTLEGVCKILAATEDEVDEQLRHVAEAYGFTREDLTVDEPPNWLDRG